MPLGELVALGAAASWSVTVMFFTEAGKLIGSKSLNRLRMVVALLLYAILFLALTGWPFPTGISTAQWFWLALSAVIGLVIGDGAGLRSLVILGPRVALLVQTVTPIFAVLLSWLFLGERLQLIDLVGIAVTLIGIGWVVSSRTERSNNRAVTTSHADAGSRRLGILLSLVASCCQATGLIISKFAMNDLGSSIDPLAASMVRLTVGAAVIWLIAIATRDLLPTLQATGNRLGMFYTVGGAFFGPFLGIWSSLYAVKLIPAGIAATLNSTAPILVLPLVWIFHRERPSIRSVLGAVIAVFGVALIFLGEQLAGLFG